MRVAAAGASEQISVLAPTVPARGTANSVDLIGEWLNEAAELAGCLCAVPLALVCLVGTDQMWPAPSTRRTDLRECDLGLLRSIEIAGADLLVVPDARADRRFAEDPLVLGPPLIRFLAGAPLISADGVVLGRLWVLDVATKELTPVQRNSLTMLARQVAGRLELHRHQAAMAADLQAAQTAPAAAQDREQSLAGMLVSAHVLPFPSIAVSSNVSELAAVRAAHQQAETRWSSIFYDSPVAMALSDGAGRWVDVNAVFCELFCRRADELIGATALDYVHPEDRGIIAGSEHGQQASPDGIHRMEARFLRPNGEIRWTWINITATPGPAGEPWTLAVVQDITTRKAAEHALRESESDLAAIASVARCVQSGADPRPVVVRSIQQLSGAETVCMLEALDIDTLVITAAQGVEGVGAQVALGEGSVSSQVWRTGQPVFLSDVTASAAVSSNIMALEGAVSAMWQPVIVHGTVQAVLLATWNQQVADPSDRAARAVRIIADEAGTSLNATRLRQDLERSAMTDTLTGSLNRRAWDTNLLDYMNVSRTTGATLTVAIVDLDHFKVFNDTYGHSMGDILLRDFAVAVRGCLRRNDMFARWGGEEFSIALPDVPPEVAGLILDRIRLSVPRGETCSIGYTNWNPAEPITSCIARADAALYDAKHGGRNRTAFRQ